MATLGKMLYRRGQVMELLGISKHEMRKLVSERVLVPVVLRKMGGRKHTRAYFARANIQAVMKSLDE
jgi:hypothetical protein